MTRSPIQSPILPVEVLEKSSTVPSHAVARASYATGSMSMRRNSAVPLSQEALEKTSAEPLHAAVGANYVAESISMHQNPATSLFPVDTTPSLSFTASQNAENRGDSHSYSSKERLVRLSEDLKADAALQNHLTSPTSKAALQESMNELKDLAYSFDISFRNISRSLSAAAQTSESSRRGLDPFRAAWTQCHQVRLAPGCVAVAHVVLSNTSGSSGTQGWQPDVRALLLTVGHYCSILLPSTQPTS